MNIQNNISLKPYNTFGINHSANYFAEANDVADLKEALLWAKENEQEILIIGGGSNILLTQDFEGLVILIKLLGIKVLNENEEDVLVKVGAGENWHEFVMHSLQQGWSGIENLSLIPGTVGASPMQNIGAYGVEIKEVFVELEGLNRESLDLEKFDKAECDFGYRESIFKNKVKNKYIITSVTFRLSKIAELNTEYGVIMNTLEEMEVKEPTPKDVSNAVIKIRQSKLPDPAEIGNAGSFFKNPTIPLESFDQLKADYPNIPGYPQERGIKVPAAWLIEQSGWKGKRFGNIGVHKKQPLVLVNYGNGEGKEIVELSKRIQESVKEKFGVMLSPEVNFI